MEKLGNADEGKAGKAVYPEGFYEALHRVHKIMPTTPILITENGFDSDNDALRDEYIKKHLYIVKKAMLEGIDIRGYLFWTLTDCYGWSSGNSSRHGIYAIDFATQERTLRDNTAHLLNTIARSSSSKLELVPTL